MTFTAGKAENESASHFGSMVVRSLIGKESIINVLFDDINIHLHIYANICSS